MAKTKLMVLTILSALFCAASIYGIYYTHQLPTEEVKTTTLCSYEHTGKYDYKAVLKPNILYNKTTLRPGEGIIYIRILEHVDITFTYTFSSSLPADITIEYKINEYLESSGWRKSVTTTPTNKLDLTQKTTARFSTTQTIKITDLEKIKSRIESEIGTSASSYTLIIQPEIRTTAKTAVGIISEIFTPTVTMRVQYRTAQGDVVSLEDLTHTSPGAITQTKKTYQRWVINRRYTTYAFSIITFSALAITIWMYTRAKPEKPLEETIKPYEEIIAEAKEPIYEGRKATITMNSLEDLAKVAESLAKPVLHTQKDQTHTFYVLDGLTTYEYTITAPIIEKKPKAAPKKKTTPPKKTEAAATSKEKKKDKH